MISFIVPAYNEELELSPTLAAIQAATSGLSQPFESIVVDDASTDATPEIAEQAGARVVSIHRRQIAAARNAGASAARKWPMSAPRGAYATKSCWPIAGR